MAYLTCIGASVVDKRGNAWTGSAQSTNTVASVKFVGPSVCM